MYFVIAKVDNNYFYQTFDDKISWKDLLKSLKGKTIVDLFKNNLLEKYHFIDYFEENYGNSRIKERKRK